jgi:hypothetical protein
MPEIYMKFVVEKTVAMNKRKLIPAKNIRFRLPKTDAIQKSAGTCG